MCVRLQPIHPLTRARLIISLVPYLREGALQLPLELTPRLRCWLCLWHVMPFPSPGRLGGPRNIESWNGLGRKGPFKVT